MSTFLTSTGDWLPWALLMGALAMVSAIFSASETALFYLSREELRRMQVGSLPERAAAKLMRDPDRLLSALLFWNLVVNLMYFTVSLIAARRLIAAGQTQTAATLSLIGFFLLILVGEVGPKVLAVQFCRPIATFTSYFTTLSIRLLDPILPFFAMTTAALRRMIWPHLKQEPYLEVDDIERAVESTEPETELAHIEQQILARILEFSDMSAEEIMRPRGTYHVWQIPVHLEDLKSRGTIPEVLLIALHDRDNVTSALMLYDLNSLPEKNLEQVADPVVYVPWCATVAETLSRLRTNVVSVASVVNEYGETIGVVTEDDILDSLFNPLSSRSRRLLEREPITVDAAGRTICEGLTTLRYLAAHLDIDYEVETDSPVTVTALFQDQLERFPEVGDQCDWEGYQLSVVQAGKPGQPIQVSVTPSPTPPSGEANS